VRLVEANQRMGLIGKAALYGRPYALLGDLSYYIEGNLDSAAARYRSAADNSYTSPLLTYKIGYVQYARRDFRAALESFAEAEDASAYPSEAESAGAASAAGESGHASAPGIPPGLGLPPQNLLYALGDAFYQRGDYFAAQASFLRLRERLETRRAALGTLRPEERPDDRALLDTLVKVNNNLGVTMYRLGEKTGDRRRKSEALVYLAAANEIASSLARSPDTVRRSEDRSLPSLNMRGILYPVSGFVLQIYADLPKDFDSAAW
jgi:tetratricopeptide (TPR) repeat protein